MGLAIAAVAFYIFTSIFALELLNSSRWKVVTLAFALTFLLMVGSSAAGQSLLALAICLAMIVLVAAMSLKFWLKATWPQSFKIAGSYVGANLAYTLAVVMLFGPTKP